MSPERILLTGATDGIGRLAAHDLAAKGHRLLLHGRNQAKLAATIAEIKQQTGQAEISGILADLASLDQVRQLAAEVLEHFGPPTILLNNAGLGSALAAGSQPIPNISPIASVPRNACLTIFQPFRPALGLPRLAEWSLTCVADAPKRLKCAIRRASAA